VLLSVLVASFVLCGVGPCLNTIAMLLIVFPFTHVFCTIHVFVGSSPVSLVILPLTVVAVPICMDEAAVTVGLVILPVALVLAAVLPNLDALAFSHAVLGPLTMVDGSIIKFIWPSSNYVPQPL